MTGIVPESWLEWGLGVEGDQTSRPSEADMLAAHDAVTTNSREAQRKLSKLVYQGRHAVHKASLDQLPKTARPRGPDDPLEETETRACAKARYRNLQGAGTTTCLRARPTDWLRIAHASEFMGIGKLFIGIEEHVTVRCPCCDAVDVDTRQSRIAPEPGRR